MTTQTLTYRFTLDAFKHGVQRVLQGFQTGESVSRKMEISISAGADPFELPTNNLTAVMYVKRPSQDSPSINACSIDALNNKIIYQIDATDIQEAGIVMMQLKLINTIGEEEAVICSPIFGMEVWESQTEDSDAEGDPTYTALTEALAAATRMKDSSIADLYIDEDTNIFTVVFGDGSVYTSDVIADAVSKVDEFDDKIDTHIQNKNNPHEVTFEQIIGLSEALAGKANTSHTHSTSDVTGLSDALAGKANTSHTHNISDVTNLQSTINNKVDKVTGKGLSTNDFTDALKTKLENITPGGQQAANWGDITGDIEDQTDLQEALAKASSASAVNLLSYPYKDTKDALIQTRYGITFVVNPEDGTITVNGTATGIAMLQLTDALPLVVGEKYNLSGCPAGGSYNGYQLCDFNTGFANDYGNGATFVADADQNHCSFKIRINTGTVCNNLVFKPMLVKGETKPEVYVPSLGIKATRDYLAESVPNLLPYPFYDGTRTSYGIQFTMTGDATIKASGTSTGSAWFSIIHSSKNYTLKAGKYSICGCPAGGSAENYWMSLNKVSGNVELARDYGNGATITLDEDTVVSMGVMVKNGATVSNIEFKPMLVPGDMIPKIFRAPEYMATFAKTKAYNNEQEIDALSADLTALTTTVAGKADTTALNSVESLLKNMISKVWDSSTTYKAGEYCWYNSKLWKCLTQNSNTTPVEGTYWTEVDVGQELFKAFSNMKNIITGVLTAGQTSITINDNSITTSSIIEPFFNVVGGTASAPICYTSITVTNGSVTMAFEALDADLTVGIRVIN